MKIDTIIPDEPLPILDPEFDEEDRDWLEYRREIIDQIERLDFLMEGR